MPENNQPDKDVQLHNDPNTSDYTNDAANSLALVQGAQHAGDGETTNDPLWSLMAFMLPAADAAMAHQDQQATALFDNLVEEVISNSGITCDKGLQRLNEKLIANQEEVAALTKQMEKIMSQIVSDQDMVEEAINNSDTTYEERMAMLEQTVAIKEQIEEIASRFNREVEAMKQLVVTQIILLGGGPDHVAEILKKFTF